MLHGLTGWHFLILLAVLLLLFGAAKLPALARSLGQSARAFKGEIREMNNEDRAAASGHDRSEHVHPAGSTGVTTAEATRSTA